MNEEPSSINKVTCFSDKATDLSSWPSGKGEEGRGEKREVGVGGGRGRRGRGGGGRGRRRRRKRGKGDKRRSGNWTLPVVSHSREEEEEGGKLYDIEDGKEMADECAICSYELVEERNLTVMVLPCCHCCHDRCLEMWSVNCQKKNWAPLIV